MCNLVLMSLLRRARGGGGAVGASAPLPPSQFFFENYKELLRKSVFQPHPSPPTLGH